MQCRTESEESCQKVLSTYNIFVLRATVMWYNLEIIYDLLFIRDALVFTYPII